MFCITFYSCVLHICLNLLLHTLILGYLKLELILDLDGATLEISYEVFKFQWSNDVLDCLLGHDTMQVQSYLKAQLF